MSSDDALATRIFAAALAACLVIPSVSAATSTSVTSCGQSFSGAGVLAADLTCTDPGLGAAVTIVRSGSLDLGGYTLTVGSNGADAIRCATCRVSNGSIVLDGDAGWAISATGKVIVSDVFVNCLPDALNEIYGYGIRGRVGRIATTSITGTWICASEFERVQARDLQCLDIIASGVEASKRAVVRDSVLTASPADVATTGVASTHIDGRITVKDSAIVGYDYSVASWYTHPPRMVATSCEHSAIMTSEGASGDWDVCALD